MIRILKIVSVELEISFYRQFTYFTEQKQILRQEELTENVGSFLCILTIKKVYNVNEVLQYVKKDVFRMWVNIFKFPLVVLIAVTCVGFGTISFITAKNALYSNMGKTLPEISIQAGATIESNINGEFKKLEAIATRSDISDPGVSVKNKEEVLASEAERLGANNLDYVDA